MKNTVRVVAFLLLAASILGVMSSVAVASEAESAAFDSQKYDYSHPNAENTVIGAADIVEDYLKKCGEELGDAERAFLERFAPFTVTYASTVTTESFSVTYDDAAGKVTVTAEPYSYTSDGRTLTWVPVSAKIGETVAPITDGSAEISGIFSEGESVTVTYEATVPIEEEDISALVNLYYDTAKYVTEHDGFGEDIAAYERYLIALRIYNEARLEYERYLGEYGEYLLELERYREYEERVRRYWEEYGRYEEYLAAAERYEAELSEYREYLEKLDRIKRQLKAFELVKVAMTDGRTVYDAVMGNLVDRVLENETALVEACGVDRPEIIWQAGDATERLRKLMTGYYERSDERQKYNYYLINYNNIKDTVLELANALNRLYRYPKVRGMLKAESKDKKYIILVAQLAYIANALTDTGLTDYDGNAAYGAKWKIEDKTIAEILQNKTYYEDKNDATPLMEGYPSARTEPAPPDAMEKPVMPEKLARPTPPDEVKDPGEPPTEVFLPSIPAPPSAFSEAVIDALTDEERAKIRAAFRAGDITRHTEVSASHAMILSSEVERHVGTEDVTVVFISDTDGVRESHTVERGGRVVFESREPYKPEDEFNSYRFSGWQTAEGVLISLDSVPYSTELYPYFEKAPKYYNVTWSVNGVTVTERVVSDIIPECPIPTEKPEDLEFYYAFDGWDKPLEPVGRDITYIALFKRYRQVAYKGGGASVTDDGLSVVCDARSCQTLDSEGISIGPLLERIAGKRALTVKTLRGDVAFSFAETIALHGLGVDSIRIEAVQVGSVSNTFAVRLYSSGVEIAERISFSAELYHNVENTGNLRLIKDDSLENTVKIRLSDSAVSFNMENGSVYRLRPVYDVAVISDEGIKITLSSLFAEPGDTVRVCAQYVTGYCARTLEVIEKESGENILGPDGTFRMPKSDVTVRGTSSVKSYVAVFTSDGAVIHSEVYSHGQRVTPPDVPAKEADGRYVYTFVTWSPDVTSYITENVTYTAIWKTETVPEKVDDGTVKLSDDVRQLLVMALCALIIFTVGVIPCIILSIVLGVKHRRRVRLVKINKKRE